MNAKIRHIVTESRIQPRNPASLRAQPKISLLLYETCSTRILVVNLHLYEEIYN